MPDIAKRMAERTIAPEHRLRKGDYAYAVTHHSYYALHTGQQSYLSYRVVRIASASRDGLAKSFERYPGDYVTRVDRRVTIYTAGEMAARLPRVFASQPRDGYPDKAALKAALDAAVMAEA